MSLERTCPPKPKIPINSSIASHSNFHGTTNGIRRTGILNGACKINVSHSPGACSADGPQADLRKGGDEHTKGGVPDEVVQGVCTLADATNGSVCKCGMSGPSVTWHRERAYMPRLRRPRRPERPCMVACVRVDEGV